MILTLRVRAKTGLYRPRVTGLPSRPPLLSPIASRQPDERSAPSEPFGGESDG